MITYKNITDVEVLEQASENTKVLVNEGGELMQAPYSNFEDKMKDAEVLEEIPESAKVLVNDGGKLKQVACEKMGGNAGGGRVIIRKHNDDFSSNYGFHDVLKMLNEVSFPGGTFVDGTPGSCYIAECMYADYHEGVIQLQFYDHDEKGRIFISMHDDGRIERFSPAPI